MAPAVWGGEKLGVIPHQAARVSYVLSSSPVAVVAHPGATLSNAGTMFKGPAELPWALTKQWRGELAKGDPTAILKGLNVARDPLGSAASALATHPRSNLTKTKLVGKEVAHSFWSDMQYRYGKHWKEAEAHEPLMDFFDTLSVTGPAFRGMAVGGALGRLAPEEGAMTKAMFAVKNPRAVWAESGRFGPRNLVYQTPEGTWRSTQIYSHSPLRAYTQMALDEIANRYPNLRGFGVRARATRAASSQGRRVVDRLLADVPGVEALGRLQRNNGESDRAYWGAQLRGSNRSNYGVTALKRLRDSLENHAARPLPDTDAAFNEWSRRAKEVGFGPGMRKSVDRAIAHAEKYPTIKTGSRLDHAINAMEHATAAAETIIKDTGGFDGVENDIARIEDILPAITDPTERANLLQQIADLKAYHAQMGNKMERIMGPRRNIVQDWVDDNTIIKSKVRDAVVADMTKRWKNSDQAEAAARVTDRLALNMAPDDPARWWRDNVGMPTNEGAEAYLKRTADLPEGASLLQHAYGPFGGERPDMYFDPLTKAVDEMGRSETVAQFKARLEKARIPKEMQHFTGLTRMLRHMGPEEKISKADLQEMLASPQNAFHLVEHHWVNNGIGEEPPWLVETNNGIVSRMVGPNEYHHLAFGLHEARRAGAYGRELMGDQPGFGFGHHGGRSGIIGHTRWSTFLDPRDGLRTMLVDEAQSDWASDFIREQKRYGKLDTPEEYGPQNLTPEQQARLEEVKIQQDWELRQQDRVDQEQFDLEQIADDRSRPRAERDEARNSLAALEREYQQHGRNFEELEEEAQRISDYKIGRLIHSPLGRSRYLDTISQRLAQVAHEDGVGKTIFTSGPTQVARNSRHEAASLLPWGSSTEDMARATRELSPDSPFHDLYEKDLPKAYARATGETPSFEPDAYEGRFSNAYDASQKSDYGPMEGTVFRHGEASAAKAKQMRPYFQMDPLSKLPRGATELLQDGKTAIRMFGNADITTWFHELGHVALHDLPDESKAILSKHYADGAEIKDWSVDAHEAYAKDFERYMATGLVPSATLAPVFAQIASWIQGLWKTAKDEIPGIDPKVRQVFDNMFMGDEPKVFMPHRASAADIRGVSGTRGIPRARREIGDQVLSQAASFKKNRLGLLRGGMLNPDPRLLIDHMHRVAMLARANQLRRMVLQMSRPLQIIGEHPDGTKIFETPDFSRQYVVKKAGTPVRKEFYDALENAENPAQVRDNIANFVDDNITENPDLVAQWQKEIAGNPSAALHVVDKETVDQLFKNMTGKTPGATTKPASTAGRVMDALLDSVRGALLYLNPGFYAANMAGNSLMMMMSDPRALRFVPWSMKQAIKGFGRGERADPLWNRIAVEMGRGPTAGGLSERPELMGGLVDREQGRLLSREGIRNRAANYHDLLTGSKGGLTNRAAQNVSHFWGTMGRGSGKIIDDSWRVAAWRQEAAKLGYKTDKQVEELLNKAVADSRKHGMFATNTKALQDLVSIRDSAEQLMLDFDSMTPFEKTWLTRTIFLYPFTRAAVKYPFMYMGERPLTAGLLGQMASQANLYTNQVLGPPDPNLPTWMQGYARTPWGYAPVSSISSFQPLMSLLGAGENVGGVPTTGIQRPIDFLNPGLNMLIDMAQQQSKFGKSQSMYKTFGQEVPVPAYIRQFFGHPPGKIYANRDIWHTLERAFRLPFQINPEVAAKEKNLSGRP